ncbi:MAG TPA: PSD1 and planctomycete cytochrome C domain-containing protein [Pirellulales bacterium]
MCSIRYWLLAWITLSCTPALPAAEPVAKPPAGDEAGNEFFERQVRPLLVRHCYACHGGGRAKGGLSLDSRAAMLAGGESGAVMAPGKPDESLLLAAVEYAGDVQMPPDGKLADDEIAALKQWLALGAPWPEQAPAGGQRAGGEIAAADRQFWSFQPLGDFAPPAVKDATWPRNAIDHFVLARLESEALQPVAAADRRTLIRRASFDLIGLPPTAAEVDAFVGDERPDAYEQLLDRLLASPHYGERWARHWLDVARYGEDQAHTFQARLYPNGYRYRDWVVEALNRDLPYDRFVIEQIAGDLVDDAPGERRGAEEEHRARLPALGFFALGPVYYADNACKSKAKFDEYDDRIDTLARGFLGLTVACARCHDHKFDPISTRDYYALAGVIASSEYCEAPLAPPEVVARYDAAQVKIKQAEEAFKQAREREARRLGESLALETDQYLLAIWTFDHRRKSQPELKLTDVARQAGLDAGIAERWQKSLTNREAAPAWLRPWLEMLEQQSAAGDLSSDPAAMYAAAEAAATVQAVVASAVERRRTLEEEYEATLAALAEGQPRPQKPSLDPAVAELLKQAIDDRNAPLFLTQEQAVKLTDDGRRQKLAAMQAEIEALKTAAGEKYPVAHSVKEGQAANLRVHLRGSATDLGDEAPRGFLAVLSPADAKPFAEGSGRLELARATASRDNPLTARVFVNRVWQHHFGRGLVGTPSNFGLLGERPTHPELLDYLAGRFIASGWSIKRLHRLIMLSATYRLGSGWQAAGQERDPDNRWLWRMNRRRLDVEAWRDTLLAVAGHLDLTMGGPSQKLDDAGNRRRTLYAAVSRHQLNPMLRLFDFPDPNLTTERRVITTVPMQQLFVLNSEFMTRQAKALAARLAQASPDDEARLDLAYRRLFGRSPHERERQFVREFLAAAAGGALSPWEQVAQALLSSNELVFVD